MLRWRGSAPHAPLDPYIPARSLEVANRGRPCVQRVASSSVLALSAPVFVLA